MVVIIITVVIMLVLVVSGHELIIEVVVVIVLVGLLLPLSLLCPGHFDGPHHAFGGPNHGGTGQSAARSILWSWSWVGAHSWVVGWDVICMSGSVLPRLAQGNSWVRLGLQSMDCIGGRH